MSFVRQSANPIFVLGFFSEKYESHICLGVFRKCANPILFMSFFSAKCESHFFFDFSEKCESHICLWVFRKCANPIFWPWIGKALQFCSELGKWPSMPTWPKCGTKYTQTHESLLPENKTTRGPSPCLQSINKPTTTLHVTIRGPTDNGFRMPTAY